MRIARTAPEVGQGRAPQFADLEEIVARARLGDPDAIHGFVRATQAEVWRFVAHLTDVQSADDLTQETFVRAIGALPAFRGASSVRTWLLSIARRTVIDEFRRRGRRPVAEALPAELPGDPDVADEAGLHDLLRRLDPDRRVAFVLTQVVGFSYADAAQVCRCPVGTIRSRVARARDDLVGMLRDHPTPGERPA